MVYRAFHGARRPTLWLQALGTIMYDVGTFSTQEHNSMQFQKHKSLMMVPFYAHVSAV